MVYDKFDTSRVSRESFTDNILSHEPTNLYLKMYTFSDR